MITPVRFAGSAFTCTALGLALVAAGLYLVSADDAPGLPVGSTLLMVGGLVLWLRALRDRLPTWAARSVLVIGAIAAAIVAFQIHRVVVTGPLFPQVQDVPSANGTTPPAQFVAAVEQTRRLVRDAVVEQNLPGVSIAVGADGAIVWSEGFGWRDIDARAPVTPDTRFNIGTASAVVSAGAASLGLTDTGTDSAADWSAGHIGEPEDDFPPFTIIRHVIFRPLGLAPAEPLPGERATFYVPRSDDNPATGRWLMYMRDLDCCANGSAFYSTPSDLVRFALATNAGSVNGELARGMVMSLLTNRDSGIAVAVAANISHANTSALAIRAADAFAERTR